MAVSMSGIIITPQVEEDSLNGLIDVVITDPVGGQVLTYDGVSLTWVNAAIPPSNLSLGTSTGTTLTIQSSTGMPVTLTAATPTYAGLMSSSDSQKLTGIQSGATVNSPDAILLNRTNHTGTQTSSTISNFIEAAQDATASLLVAGANITLVYDDLSNTLTIAGAGPGTTDLALGVLTDATVEITSSSGTSVILPEATTTLAGVMSGADKSKLTGIQPGATANLTDIFLLDRANHTGTQTSATISDFNDVSQAVIDGYLEAGTNIELFYNSITDKLVINSTGAGSAGLPDKRVAFGSITNEVTSSAEFMFDRTSNALTVGSLLINGSNQSITGNTSNADIRFITSGTGRVIIGSAGNALISSDLTESLTITGDTGIILQTNGNGIMFDLPAAELVTVFDDVAYLTALSTAPDGALVTKGYVDSVVVPDAVSSVFGRAGAVAATAGDYSAFYLPLTGGEITGNLTVSVGGAVLFEEEEGLINGGCGVNILHSDDGNQEFVLTGGNVLTPAQFGDLGIRLVGSYIMLDSNTIATRLTGAEIGSRLIATGVDSFGTVFLGWEPPPTPPYVVSTINNSTNVVLNTPGTWVELAPAMTITYESGIGIGEANIYYACNLDNGTRESGVLEFGIKINGVNPLGGTSYSVSEEFSARISGVARNSTTAINDTDTVTPVVRILSETGTGFLITIVNTVETPTEVELRVLDSGTGLVAQLNDLIDANIASPVAGQVLGYDGTVWTNMETSAIFSETTSRITKLEKLVQDQAALIQQLINK